MGRTVIAYQNYGPEILESLFDKSVGLIIGQVNLQFYVVGYVKLVYCVFTL